jgi:asparagine synthase (glutamine-hydrolysing)
MTASKLIAGCVTTAHGRDASWGLGLARGMTTAYEHRSDQAVSMAYANPGVTTARPSGSVTCLVLGAPYRRDGSGAPFTAEALAEELGRDPERALASLGGAFALALVDHGRMSVTLAVDRFSIENLFFVCTPQGFAFANRAQWLADHPSVGNRISAQALYDSVYFHSLPSPQAGYVGMSRLLPGHVVTWRPGGLTNRPYWQPSFSAEPAAPGMLESELRQAIERAVVRNLSADSPACFLSGGLDSSTVAGFCARHRPLDSVAYTIGFEADGYDEMDFARNVASHFGMRHESYYVTPRDIIDALPAIVQEFDAPFGNASAIPTYYCAKLAAAAGHRTILAGDGGDELFGGNVRYSKQLQFERYWRLPALLRHAFLGPLLGKLPEPLRVGLIGKASSYVRQASVPLPDRLMTYNLLNFIEPSRFLSPKLLAHVDSQAPFRLLRDMYDAPAGTHPINRLLKLDWRLTLADSDLPKVSRMCALAGIDVRYPMLDEDVVDVSLRVPVDGKVTTGELRPLFRRAFADFLPRATLTKSKQGFGLPFGVWLMSDAPLRDFAQEHLRWLEQERLLAPGFRQDFFDSRMSTHPGYYGTLVWILMTLSLWLQCRKPVLEN